MHIPPTLKSYGALTSRDNPPDALIYTTHRLRSAYLYPYELTVFCVRISRRGRSSRHGSQRAGSSGGSQFVSLCQAPLPETARAGYPIWDNKTAIDCISHN